MQPQTMFALFVVLLVGVCHGIITCDQKPADPYATIPAQNLLCYLKTHSYVSGQTDVEDAEYVRSFTGRYPAIVAFDFYHYTDGDTSDTPKAINWTKTTGGIVAFQWHWKCPYGGEFYSPCNFMPDLNNSTSKLWANIDLIMTELKKIQDAGYAVLFRPLHESNNNYFWWTKSSYDGFKGLWKLMWNRAQAIGTHNLVWVFNGMASGQSTEMAWWYPGDDQADVVSTDYFQSWDDYNKLKGIGNNKVVALSETFNQLNPASDPPFATGVVWASRDWGNHGTVQSWKTAMANSKTITIDQLPNMTNAVF